MSGNSNFVATATTTTNNDRRAALQDSVFVGDGSTSSSVSNSYSTTYAADAEVLRTLADNIPDAAVALGQMSATTLRDVGGAVVNLNKDSIEANTRAWDSTLAAGAGMLDKVQAQMAASMGLASKVVDSFTPTENKNADIGKYAMWAVGAVALAVLFWKK